MEKTISLNGSTPRVIAGPTQLQVFEDEQDTIKVVKMHGDFEKPDFIVFTKNDYDNFFKNNKVIARYVENIFRSNTILMFGYSGMNPDYKQILEYRKSLGNFSKKFI
ncbi:SIR2 family protein [Bacillus rhizoplanae]|uniref:SIR2 family protein n=1 Tax=Bacillus rhizoplanae TaxID=2880966 RepID=UPI003D1DCF55